jgi:predicted Rossmann-fold nucleotide-binding protein
MHSPHTHLGTGEIMFGVGLSALQLFAGSKAKHPLPKWVLYIGGGIGLMGLVAGVAMASSSQAQRGRVV